MSNWAWPVPGVNQISSPFGQRWGRLHAGIDIPARTGTQIIASRAGRVSFVGSQGSVGYGLWIELDHGGGWRTRYAHNSRNLVAMNQQVPAGHVIALVGSTGSSTGPHLHFETRHNGTPLNPMGPPVNLRMGAKPPPHPIGAGVAAGAAGAAANMVNNVPLPPAPGPAWNQPGGLAGQQEPQRKEITRVVEASVTGATGARRENALRSLESVLDHGYEIMIQNRQTVMLPVLEGDITVEWERRGHPGVMKFNVVNDEALSFSEGDAVRLRVNGKNMFYGYVFTKSRNAPGDVISVTAYDQMRYLKNRGTLAYTGQYSALLMRIANDYNLVLGDVADTGHTIPNRIEETTLMDMLMTAMEITVKETGDLFVLYDDFGRLMLQNLDDMRLPIMIDHDTISGYRYTSSIDEDTYNRIVLALDNDTTGARELYITNSDFTQSRWGILQHYDNVNDVTPQVLRERGKVLLESLNRKTRRLRLEGCFGDIRVRGGSSVAINMGLGDLLVRNFMVVERVKHTFSNGSHLMDLVVVGARGEFVA